MPVKFRLQLFIGVAAFLFSNSEVTLAAMTEGTTSGTSPISLVYNEVTGNVSFDTKGATDMNGFVLKSAGNGLLFGNANLTVGPFVVTNTGTISSSFAQIFPNGYNLGDVLAAGLAKSFLLSDLTFTYAQTSGGGVKPGQFLTVPPTVITIHVASGTYTQAQMGYSTLSGSIPVVKTGAGTLVLDQANTLTAQLTLSAGKVALAGFGSIGTGGLNLGATSSNCTFDLTNLGSGTYFLLATGNLSGAGTLSGNGKTITVLGSFLPGNSPGTVTVDTGFTLDLASSGSSVFDITSPLFTGGTFDLVNGDGSVVLGGVLNLAFTNGPYTNGTDVLQIFANTGGRTGNFTSVVATGLGLGQYATFNPSTGFVGVVPEPSTCVTLAAGLACGGYSMWRRRKRA